MDNKMMKKVLMTFSASAVGALVAWGIINWIPSVVILICAALAGAVAWKYLK